MDNSSRSAYPLLFVTSNLGGGGAERALVNLLNSLDRHLFRPHLALFQRQGVYLDQLAEDVQVFEIQPQESWFPERNRKRFVELHRLYRQIQPRLVMSIKWQANAVTLLSTWLSGSKIPCVINEQSAPQASLRSDSRRRMLWPIASRVYRQAKAVIVISKGIAHELEQTAGIPAQRIHVIHNPLALEQFVSQSKETIAYKINEAPAILAAGRLTPLKNYPLLLRAAALVLQQRPIEVYILGEGPEQTTIENMAGELGITDHVHLLGFVNNPAAYITQAEIFTLTSNHEGFGNVLVEAMALGVPVVSTDCPYGPREILSAGDMGILVPVNDEAALANAWLQLLEHPEQRARFARLGKQRAQDFTIERIIPLYERTFLDLIEA